MTLLLGDRRLQGLGYPGLPEDQVNMVKMVLVNVLINTLVDPIMLVDDGEIF